MKRSSSLRRSRHREEQRGRQRVGGRQELVVQLHLAGDLLRLADALGPEDLLDLEPERHPVLEHQEHPVADIDASIFLVGHDPLAEVVADALVERGPHDVGDAERFHE
jgi:hypothetical protein